MMHPRIEPSFAGATGDPFASEAFQPGRSRLESVTPLGAAWAGAAVAALLLAAPCLFGPSDARAPAPVPAAVSAPPKLAVKPVLADPDVTGSLGVADPAGATAKIVRPQGFTLLLGEASSAETLWGWWRILQQRHKTSIGTLTASVVQAEGAPARHRLTAGPFQNAAAAAELCGRWRADGTTCQVAGPDGSKL